MLALSVGVADDQNRGAARFANQPITLLNFCDVPRAYLIRPARRGIVRVDHNGADRNRPMGCQPFDFVGERLGIFLRGIDARRPGEPHERDIGLRIEAMKYAVADDALFHRRRHFVAAIDHASRHGAAAEVVAAERNVHGKIVDFK